MLQVEVANRQTEHTVDEDRLVTAVRTVLEGEQFRTGEISIAVVNDDEMRQLNRQYLQHDYATDVLSFVLDADDKKIDGQLIVSVDTAARSAIDFGWSAAEELLLYVTHGTLHLAGFRDKTTAEQEEMRSKEAHYLRILGVERYNQPS